MAIKIIKEGKQQFTAICSRCGCEFTYELADLHGETFINCPCCKQPINHEVFDVVGTYNPHQLNDLVYRPYTLPDWATLRGNFDGCEGCPNNPKYLKIPHVGDIPCQWCQKNPYKLTCTSNVK